MNNSRYISSGAANKGPARTQEVRVPELCGAKICPRGGGRESPPLEFGVVLSLNFATWCMLSRITLS